jgi:hypothetical protein
MLKTSQHLCLGGYVHSLENVNKFLVTQTIKLESARVAQQIVADLKKAANDRHLLTTMAIHEVLGQDLAQSYFHWYGKQTWPDPAQPTETEAEYANTPG